MIDEFSIYRMVKLYRQLHQENNAIAVEITTTSIRRTKAKFYGDTEQLEFFINTFIEEAERVLKDMHTIGNNKEEE